LVAVLGADAGEEAALLVAERLQAQLLDLFEQLVHAALLGLALLLLALGLALGAALEPALQPALPPPRRGRRPPLLPLQAGVSLRESVAEERPLPAGLQPDPPPAAPAVTDTRHPHP